MKIKKIKLIDLYNQNSVFLFTTFIFVALFFLINGYSFWESDHNEQIPRVLRIVDEHYLSSDWWLNSVSANFTPRTVFVLTMGLLSKVLGLKAAYFLVYIFLLFFLVFYLSKIMYLLYPDIRAIPPFLYMVLFCNSYALGGNLVVDNSLIPSYVSLSLIVYVVYCFMRKKYLLCFLWLGIVFCFHWVNGLLLAGFLFSYLVIFLFKEKVDKRDVFVSFLIFSFFVLLNLFFARNDFLNFSDGKEKLVFILARFRHPHHHVPSTWGKDIFAKFGLLSLPVPLFYLVRKDKFRNPIVLWALFYGLVCFVFGWVFVEKIPLPLIAKLQLFRFSTILRIFLFAFWSSTLTVFNRRSVWWGKFILPVFLFSCYQAKVGWLFLSEFLLFLGFLFRKEK